MRCAIQPCGSENSAVQHEHPGGERQDRAVVVAEPAARRDHGQHRGRQDQQRIMREAVRRVDEGDQARVRASSAGLLAASPGVSRRLALSAGAAVGCPLTVDRTAKLCRNQTPPDRARLRPFEQAPRPLVGYAFDYAAGHDTGWHQHPRAQLLYAIAGVMRVVTAGGAVHRAARHRAVDAGADPPRHAHARRPAHARRCSCARTRRAPGRTR